MTIEEKLTHFYDTSVEEARRQAEKDVREHKEALDAALEEHKKMSLGNAASSRKAEIANAKREINKALSAEQLHIRPSSDRSQPGSQKIPSGIYLWHPVLRSGSYFHPWKRTLPAS